MDPNLVHQTVLLREAIEALQVRRDGVYIDGTFGRGGHAAALLDRLGPDGVLLAFDRDPAAGQIARSRFQQDSRLKFLQKSFSHISEVAERAGLVGDVAGMLLDLGVSSPQLDDPRRGFSFIRNGPLDMRMDPTGGINAAEWLADAAEAEIARVLWEFGEERFARRIARAIVVARRTAAIETTGQLAEIIAATVPTREPGKHPATRSFQAIRIVVNRELQELKSVLDQALPLLAAGGRLVVISFHSLEDRIVKRFMRDQARGQQWPLDLPVPVVRSGATMRIIGKAVKPSSGETRINPRSRSAVMRTAERIA